MSIEAMKQALEALERIGMKDWVERKEYAITALRQAIEQAEKQEPIGEIVQAFGDLTAVSIPVMPPVGTKLYAAPPQREWIGLTDEEAVDIRRLCVNTPLELCHLSNGWAIHYARQVEAKLKEKNT